MKKRKIKWNNNLKLIISDVDETIADLYVDAEPEMVNELEKLLIERKILFLVSGQSVQNINKRIVNYIKKRLRKQIIIGHCSGVEVWGFDEYGNLRQKPFYSLYEKSLTDQQKKKWRDLVQQLIKEFKLKVFPTGPILEFKKKTAGHPLAIMVEDRGPQITFEVVNGYDLSVEQASKLEVLILQTHGSYDLRVPILERAEKLFAKSHLPLTPRLAGVFAIDFAVKGISKTTAVKYVMQHDSILAFLGLTWKDLTDPQTIEVWGDKFSIVRGGTDRHLSEALLKQVRSISFRKENSEEFLPGYNIVVWDGQKYLHKGLLEFLKSRY